MKNIFNTEPFAQLSFGVLVAIVISTSAILLISLVYSLVCLRKKLFTSAKSVEVKSIQNYPISKFSDLRVDMSKKNYGEIFDIFTLVVVRLFQNSNFLKTEISSFKFCVCQNITVLNFNLEILFHLSDFFEVT